MVDSIIASSSVIAAAKVAKIKAWTELAKSPKTIIGTGIKIGTREHNTVTVNSSAKMFPNNRKFKDKGLIKSSTILIGNKSAVGFT